MPGAVDLEKLFKDLSDLKDINKRSVIGELSPALKLALKETFESDPAKISKIEQFYRLVYYIARNKKLSDRKLQFDTDQVRALLISSKVFSTPEFPKHIAEVTLYYSDHYETANYEVKFDQKEVRLPLNGGQGFSNFREGLCQVAKELIFSGPFEFDVKQSWDKNIFVEKFKNVDLYGTFGSRGVVDVDINYVSVKSVEFMKGTPLGIVRAKVAAREWQINSHSTLLRMLASLVTDKSTQPIDW